LIFLVSLICRLSSFLCRLFSPLVFSCTASRLRLFLVSVLLALLSLSPTFASRRSAKRFTVSHRAVSRSVVEDNLGCELSRKTNRCCRSFLSSSSLSSRPCLRLRLFVLFWSLLPLPLLRIHHIVLAQVNLRTHQDAHSDSAPSRLELGGRAGWTALLLAGRCQRLSVDPSRTAVHLGSTSRYSAARVRRGPLFSVCLAGSNGGRTTSRLRVPGSSHGCRTCLPATLSRWHSGCPCASLCSPGDVGVTVPCGHACSLHCGTCDRASAPPRMADGDHCRWAAILLRHRLSAQSVDTPGPDTCSSDFSDASPERASGRAQFSLGQLCTTCSHS